MNIIKTDDQKYQLTLDISLDELKVLYRAIDIYNHRIRDDMFLSLNTYGLKAEVEQALLEVIDHA